MNPPFDLENGLFLEKSKTLLPWGSPVEKLTSLASPEIFRHPSTTNISWNSENVFGGLPVKVDMQGAAGQNVFYLQPTHSALSAEEEYEELLAALSNRLGKPHSTITDAGYPWSRWTWGCIEVSLRIDQRFLKYVVLRVAKGW